MKPDMLMSRKIQILRGISIIAVVLTHTLPGKTGQIFYRPLINFAVGMFIFLSGYLTSIDRFSSTPDTNGSRARSVRNNILSFYGKRLGRVLAPYLLWSLIYTVYYGRYRDFWPRLLTGRCCGIYYYIFVYVQLTLLTPILCFALQSACGRTAQNRRDPSSAQALLRFLPLLAITPAAIFVQYLLAWKQIYLIYPWNINTFPVWISFYVLGLLLGNGLLLPKIPHRTLCAAYALAFLLEVAEGMYWLSFGREDIASSQVKLSDMCLTVIVLLIARQWLLSKKAQKDVSRRFSFLPGVLILLGNLSFTIYLVHPLVISLCKSVFLR